jgi:hypothetical protein
VDETALDMYEDAWVVYTDTEILEGLRVWNRDPERGTRRFTAATLVEIMNALREEKVKALPPPPEKPSRYNCLGQNCGYFRCKSCKVDVISLLPEWAQLELRADIERAKNNFKDIMGIAPNSNLEAAIKRMMDE